MARVPPDPETGGGGGGGVPDDGSVTTVKLANGSVTTQKVANGAITNDKLANPQADIPQWSIAQRQGSGDGPYDAGISASSDVSSYGLVARDGDGRSKFADPEDDQDAATKKWVEDEIAALVPEVATSVDVQEFSVAGAGSWSKPEGAAGDPIVLLVGGGGGGGKGALGPSTAFRAGGAGGGAGGMLIRSVPLALLSDTEPVFVGNGGAGATSMGSASVADTGLNGSAGQASSFGAAARIYIAAGGGQGGQGGTTDANISYSTLVGSQEGLAGMPGGGNGGGSAYFNWRKGPSTGETNEGGVNSGFDGANALLCGRSLAKLASWQESTDAAVPLPENIAYGGAASFNNGGRGPATAAAAAASFSGGGGAGGGSLTTSNALRAAGSVTAAQTGAANTSFRGGSGGAASSNNAVSATAGSAGVGVGSGGGGGGAATSGGSATSGNGGSGTAGRIVVYTPIIE